LKEKEKVVQRRDVVAQMNDEGGEKQMDNKIRSKCTALELYYEWFANQVLRTFKPRKLVTGKGGVNKKNYSKCYVGKGKTGAGRKKGAEIGGKIGRRWWSQSGFWLRPQSR